MGSSSSAERRANRSTPPPQHPPRAPPSAPPVVPNQSAANRGPMPQHLMIHQNPQFQQRFQGPPQAAQQQPAAQVHAELKEAKNVSALCSVHAKSIKIVGDCLYFEVTTQVPLCAYEVHVAIRETIRKGEVIFTPNRPKPAPQPVTIEGTHDELEIVFPLDLTNVTEQEKKYLKEYPKQVPIAIVMRYTTETGETMSEYTYLQFLPKVSVVKQLVGTKEGIFKVENLFGIDEENGAAVAVVADGSGQSPQAKEKEDLEDDGEDCVICLTNPKDTAVIPCRHVCLCKECAEPLRKQSPKCPVCRGPIDQLLFIGRH